MKSRFLMSIITSAIVLTGFGSSIGFSNVASAQNLPPGSQNIPQEMVDRLCKPGNFDWAIRNHYKGIRLTSQQKNRLRPVYENYRKEVQEYMKSNNNGCIDFSGEIITFSKQILNIFTRYSLTANKILTKEQSVQFTKNVNDLWTPPQKS
jgi:hypothetical protein